MGNTILLIPLILIFSGAGAAALFGLPSVNGRISLTRMSWLLALAPFIAFSLLLGMTLAVILFGPMQWQVTWLPTYNWQLGFYFDSLSALFALLITFIGTLIIIYTGQYFKGDQKAWRFLVYLLLFMGAMLGLVMAGDVLTLFIFWEGTSVTSYLLVAYKYQDPDARYGAFRALLITGGGAIAMLIGLLIISSIVGSTQFTDILSSGDALRQSDLYTLILILVTLGAFTKSAQFPFHIWLPGAMSAPTPASAYLHSATMVKAGIFLLMRLNPTLGFTEEWFWLLTTMGLITMLVGAYLGLKQNDLKALLAYSTISQLGVFAMLIGQEDAPAYKALVIGIVAHALYKSALFMVAGIVDHEAGTRDLRRLGGLRHALPYTFIAAFIAGLSMAGLPPLFGFLAKETLLATSLHSTLPPLASQVMTAAAVATGALMFAQAGLFVYGTFMGQPRDPAIQTHKAPPAMWLAPAIPALLSLLIAFVPAPKEEAILLTNAASDAFGQPVSVSLKLWHGLNAPLLLSGIAISLGVVIFIFRRPIRAWQQKLASNLSWNGVYTAVLRGMDGGGALVLRLQSGKLRSYLVIIILAAVVLVVGFSSLMRPDWWAYSWAGLNGLGEIRFLRVFTLLVAVGAAAATVWQRRDVNAILALGAMGLSVAVLFVLEPAPDVALVQIVVDILSLVILVLALGRLPREHRVQAQAVSDRVRAGRSNVWRDTAVALTIGTLVTGLTFIALTSRPRASVVTPYYEANAKTLTGATDIVGAIVVDFRALDTLLEITVFGMAGLGVFTLLYYAARKHGDTFGRRGGGGTAVLPTRGISGQNLSPFIRVPAYATLPLALMLAATQIMYGHDQPGDGFTAGVIIGLSVSLWYIVFGYEETRRRLPWLKATTLIGSGILLAIVNGVTAIWFTGYFLGNVDYGALVGLPLPTGLHISSSFILEIAICLAVLGSVAHILNSLGHPGDQ